MTSTSSDGSPASFTVKLAGEPSGKVEVIVESEPGEVEVLNSRLTFSPAPWDVPQVVTLRGVPDDEVDEDQVPRVTVSVDAGSSAEEYKNVSPQVIRVTTTNVD